MKLEMVGQGLVAMALERLENVGVIASSTPVRSGPEPVALIVTGQTAPQHLER